MFWRDAKRRLKIDTQFVLPVVSPTLMAIVVLHGFIDLAHPTSLLAYTAALTSRPTYSGWDSVVFGFASVVHFSEDSGFFESILLHLLILVLHAFLSSRAAVVLVLAHFHLVHLPRLWFEAFEEEKHAQALLLVAGLVVSIVVPRRVCASFLRADEGGVFVLSWQLQRFVALHVVASFLR